MNCQHILQTFMQKDLTEVKIFQKVRGLLFLKHPVYMAVLSKNTCKPHCVN